MHDPSNESRRSERREERVPLRMVVALPDGQTAEVTAQTLVVNRHGAKIYADAELLVGCKIHIKVGGQEKPVEGVVVWVSKDLRGIYGIEIAGEIAPWGQA